MKKLILLSIIFVNLAFGYNYNDLLLKAQASIFPKIMLLDKNIKNKLINGKIIYTIVYEQTDYDVALKIMHLINTKYNGHINKYEIKINLVPFSELSKNIDTTAIYVLNTDISIQKVIHIASIKNIITFSYDINNLKKGLLFSLVIEKSTVLYLNKENLYTRKIDFPDSLLQMVHFVDTHTVEGESSLNFDDTSLVQMYTQYFTTKEIY